MLKSEKPVKFAAPLFSIFDNRSLLYSLENMIAPLSLVYDNLSRFGSSRTDSERQH